MAAGVNITASLDSHAVPCNVAVLDRLAGRRCCHCRRVYTVAALKQLFAVILKTDQAEVQRQRYIFWYLLRCVSKQLFQTRQLLRENNFFLGNVTYGFKGDRVDGES